MFYYLFGLFCIIILILAIFDLLPVIKIINPDKHQDRLPLKTAFFIDKNIIDLKM